MVPPGNGHWSPDKILEAAGCISARASWSFGWGTPSLPSQTLGRVGALENSRQPYRNRRSVIIIR